MDIFTALLSQARSVLKEHPNAEQAIVVATAGGSTYTLVNHHIMDGNYQDEDGFLSALSHLDDTHILQLICMWQGGGVDLPSMHLRKGLVEINRSNKLTGILLQGEFRYLVKPLADTLPN